MVSLCYFQAPQKGWYGLGMEDQRGGIQVESNTGHQPDTKKKAPSDLSLRGLVLLVAGVGFEPTTFRL